MSEIDRTVVVQYSPDDLLAAVLLIDHACAAGAYRGWDTINKAYEIRQRLSAFAEQWRTISQPTQNEGDKN